jgi:hypothetical protein
LCQSSHLEFSLLLFLISCALRKGTWRSCTLRVLLVVRDQEAYTANPKRYTPTPQTLNPKRMYYLSWVRSEQDLFFSKYIHVSNNRVSCHARCQTAATRCVGWDLHPLCPARRAIRSDNTYYTHTGSSDNQDALALSSRVPHHRD